MAINKLDMKLWNMRDEFAAKAMQSTILLIPNMTLEEIGCGNKKIAAMAYDMADKMLKARESTKQELTCTH